MSDTTRDDRGPGVPEAMREKVFEKYEQVEARGAGVSINRGLGLTFCRLAVEAQGGTIWIDQAPGGGACICPLAKQCGHSTSIIIFWSISNLSAHPPFVNIIPSGTGDG